MKIRRLTVGEDTGVFEQEGQLDHFQHLPNSVGGLIQTLVTIASGNARI